MELSSNADNILAQINHTTKLGDLRKIARVIKKNHDLAMELWSTGKFLPRQLAILIMDQKLLSQNLINKLVEDMQTHPLEERTQLIDWLMANQLTKDKKTTALVESWETSPYPLQKRIYWYYQARLRWVGQMPPANTPDLLSAIESSIANEEPEVQWAMNFTAGWIGVYDKQYRNQCVALGEKQVFIKAKWCQRAVHPVIYQNSLRWKAASEIYK